MGVFTDQAGQMSLSSDKKSKRINLSEFATFSHNFILEPHTVFTKKEKCRSERDDNKAVQQKPAITISEASVSSHSNEQKHIGIRWNFDNITLPNWHRIKYVRRPPRAREHVKREDTFDADFMMPTQVREVLESEGLPSQVINSTIGKSEQKHKDVIQKMTDRKMAEKIELQGLTITKPAQTTSPRHVGGATVITTQASPRQPGASNISPLSWLNLRKEDSPDEPKNPTWENPFLEHRKKQFDHLSWSNDKLSRGLRNEQPEEDKRRWESAQHAEILYTGPQFTPPRIVLVSSKIPKCHLLTKVYKDDVIPIVYDFETSTFTDILDTITKKLEVYRRRCKAKSILILCQGGPGYIYLLRNCAITPQKLSKPTYKGVIEFWRYLGDMVSKINPREAAIHVTGFSLTENEQGRRLLPMLQSFMYPNLVSMSNPSEDTREGEEILEHYFNVDRYRIWKMHQHTSASDIDYVAEERQQEKARVRRALQLTFS